MHSLSCIDTYDAEDRAIRLHATPHRAGAHTASLPERVKPSHASHRPHSRARHRPLVAEAHGEATHHALSSVRAVGCTATHTEIALCCIGSLSICVRIARTP